jgi:DHA1 family multidrug resistance protein-like MFS transporter
MEPQERMTVSNSQAGTPVVTGTTSSPAAPKFSVAILLGSILISTVGIGFVVPFLPVFATELGATGFALGLIMASFSLSMMITQPLAGSYSDRLGRKYFLAAGLAVFSVAGFLYVLTSSVGDIVLVRFLQGIGGGLIFSVSMAYMGDLAPEGYEGRYMGVYNVTMLSGFGIGPLLGGVLKDTFGMDMSFYGMGLTSAIACILVLFLLPESRSRDVRAKSKRVFAVFGEIMAQTRVRGVLLIRFSVMLSMVPSFIFLPVLMTQVMDASGVQIGMVITVRTLVSASLQYPFGWLADRHSRVVMTVVSVFGMAAVVSLFGFATEFWHVLLLFGFLGIGEALFMPANSAMILEGGRSHGMGATMGLLNTAMTIGMFVGSLGAGLLVDGFGFRIAFMAIGVIVALSASVSVPMMTATPRESS